MVLFLFLDVVEGFADVLVGKFEHAGVVQMGRVLFDSQRVGAEIFVVLLVAILTVVSRRKGGHGFASARRGRNGAGADLIQGIQMLVFRGGHLRKQILQLGILGAPGVLGVLVDTELFLLLHVLKKGLFFLGQLQHK